MTHKPIFPRQPDPFDTAMRDLESQLEASRAEVKRLQWLVEAEGVRVKSAEAEVQRLHGLADELARVEAARAALERERVEERAVVARILAQADELEQLIDEQKAKAEAADHGK